MNILIPILSFFDGGLEGIIKAFTKLDKKLDAHIASLQAKEQSIEASVVSLELRRNDIIDEANRAKRIKKNVAALVA